jgi:hypothetical protein
MRLPGISRKLPALYEFGELESVLTSSAILKEWKASSHQPLRNTGSHRSQVGSKALVAPAHGRMRTSYSSFDGLSGAVNWLIPPSRRKLCFPLRSWSQAKLTGAASRVHGKPGSGGLDGVVNSPLGFRVQRNPRPSFCVNPPYRIKIPSSGASSL